MHERLGTAMGDPGCLSIFGRKLARPGGAVQHRLSAEHITAEYRVRTEGRGRTVHEWKLPAHKPDNPCPPMAGLVRLRGRLRSGSVNAGRPTARDGPATRTAAQAPQALRTPKVSRIREWSKGKPPNEKQCLRRWHCGSRYFRIIFLCRSVAEGSNCGPAENTSGRQPEPMYNQVSTRTFRGDERWRCGEDGRGWQFWL